MKRNYQMENRNYLLRTTCKSSRDPEKQVFDNYDYENDFINLKIINLYRLLGERVMQQNGN
ncbi:MAG: hypothetical protein KFF73_19895 [Cyclobacteriaceae bacterium]|nr:hypothetical protein [Cyclobacteriaceae bacterium]